MNFRITVTSSNCLYGSAASSSYIMEETWQINVDTK
jgi:hypothetical protein